MSLKCVCFAQAKYREKEEELAEAIDRLEEEMRYASPPHSNDHKPRWRHGMMQVLTWLWWLGRSALASREEEHEQSVEQIERRQIDETKGLKEEFRKDQEA